MHPEIYIDYAIRLLEVYKRKKRYKKLNENFIGDLYSKIKNFIKGIVNRIKMILKRFIGEESAENVARNIEKNTPNIVKIVQNPKSVKYSFMYLKFYISKFKNVLVDCNNSECNKAKETLIKVEKELEEHRKKLILESGIIVQTINILTYVLVAIGLLFSLIMLFSALSRKEDDEIIVAAGDEYVMYADKDGKLYFVDEKGNEQELGKVSRKKLTAGLWKEKANTIIKVIVFIAGILGALFIFR